MSERQRIIAIEEHFVSPMMAKLFSGHHELSPFLHSARKLQDLGEARIREMDEAGIDVQVISHIQPGPQVFKPDLAVTLAREATTFFEMGLRYIRIGLPVSRRCRRLIPKPQPTSWSAPLRSSDSRVPWSTA